LNKKTHFILVKSLISHTIVPPTPRYILLVNAIMPPPRIYFLLFLSNLYTLALAQLQFITYNGSLTGTYHPGPSSPSACSSYFLSPMVNSVIEVGVNPPWDTNPFYLSLYHNANVANATFDQCLVQPCTFDSIVKTLFLSRLP